jgi:hypothetical protein
MKLQAHLYIIAKIQEQDLFLLSTPPQLGCPYQLAHNDEDRCPPPRHMTTYSSRPETVPFNWLGILFNLFSNSAMDNKIALT